MKKFLLSIALLQFISLGLHAQTHYGTSAGTLGTSHSYFGYFAGNASTSGSSYNSFMGARAGRYTASGDYNTAMGSEALYNNNDGSSNTAVGAQALHFNTNGGSNVAIGVRALGNNTGGGINVAYGYRSMYLNTTGHNNSSLGAFSLYNNTTATENVAAGFKAAYNTTGQSNVTTGAYALLANSTGNYNCAFGAYALSTITTGTRNSAFGMNAGVNTCSSGSFNTFFGAYSDIAPSANCDLVNTVAIGYSALVTASNQVRIGNSAVTSIGGQVSWSTLSDGRFKKDVKRDVAGLELINQLNPVSYTLDKDAYDKFLGISDNIRQTEEREIPRLQIGFVAQEVESIVKKSGYAFNGVDAPEHENAPYSIRYAEFVVPLTKAVQELTAIGNARQKKINELKAALEPYLKNVSSVEKTPRGLAYSDGVEIRLALPDATAEANLIIYNSEGKQLKDTQVSERGETTIKISNNELSPGIYFYALIADGSVMDINELTLK